MGKSASITFTRSLQDDLDVIRILGLHEEENGLETQLRNELSDFIDVSKLKIDERKTINADTYQFVGSIDLSHINQDDPSLILENLVETLQRAYTLEFAAGEFQIPSIIVDEVVFDTNTLLSEPNAALSPL